MPNDVQATPAQPQPKPVVEETPIQRKQRILARVKTFRENMLTSAGKVNNQDQNKVYCWVNHREERRLFFESMGWEQCTAKNAPAVKSQYRREDGTHVRADLILYQIDRDNYEVIQYDRELRSIEAVEGVEVAFRNSSERLGAPVFKPKFA